MGVSPYFAGQMLKFARAVVNEHRKRLDIPYPPASKPGEYPRKRTGNLKRSTVVRPLSVAEVSSSGQVKIGFLERAYYGVILEYEMGRTGLGKTIQDIIRTRVKGGRLPNGITWTRTRSTL